MPQGHSATGSRRRAPLLPHPGAPAVHGEHETLSQRSCAGGGPDPQSRHDSVGYPLPPPPAGLRPGGGWGRSSPRFWVRSGPGPGGAPPGSSLVLPRAGWVSVGCLGVGVPAGGVALTLGARVSGGLRLETLRSPAAASWSLHLAGPALLPRAVAPGGVNAFGSCPSVFASPPSSFGQCTRVALQP